MTCTGYFFQRLFANTINPVKKINHKIELYAFITPTTGRFKKKTAS